MEQILPQRIDAFMRRFGRLRGTLRGLRLRNRSSRVMTAEMRLTVQENGKSVRLKLIFSDVEEYRFQRRPGTALFRLKNVQIDVFEGLFYINLDAWADEERPERMDYRASDAFLAARMIQYEITPPKEPKP